MRVYITQLIQSKLFVVLAVGMICGTTLATQQPEPERTIDRDAITKMMVEQFEPWIHPPEFKQFIQRLGLSEEMKDVANTHWKSYTLTGNVIKQDLASALWKAGLLELMENGSNLDGFEIHKAQAMCREFGNCEERTIRRLMRHRDEFLAELHASLQVDDDTWQKASRWIRRYQLVHDTSRGAYHDFARFPDLIDQYDRMVHEDKDFLMLVDPTSKSTTDVAETVKTLLDDWAMQTDELVGTYMIQRARWRWKEHEAELSPDQSSWHSAYKRNFKNKQRRIKLYSISEDVAAVIEPEVGPWAAERWRQATRFAIYPESCQENSFERQYASLIDKGTLDEEDIEYIELHALQHLKSLSRLRSSLCEAALWYHQHLTPKEKGFDVPPFPINLHDVDKEYVDVVDAMLDILCERLPSEESLDLKISVLESRNQNGYVDHPFPVRRMMFMNLSNAQ